MEQIRRFVLKVEDTKAGEEIYVEHKLGMESMVFVNDENGNPVPALIVRLSENVSTVNPGCYWLDSKGNDLVWIPTGPHERLVISVIG